MSKRVFKLVFGFRIETIYPINVQFTQRHIIIRKRWREKMKLKMQFKNNQIETSNPQKVNQIDP